MIYILPTDTCFGMACSLDDIKNYEKIYKIKKRNLDKALAILVPNFEWLERNTLLNLEQVKFLRKYDKPFTILTKSPHVSSWINFVNEATNEEFINRAVYEKIAFRVANNAFEDRLLKENGPMFLTSANLSGEPEIYTSREIREKFSYYLDKNIIKFVGENAPNLEKKNPSEVFEFDGESLKQIFLRK